VVSVELFVPNGFVYSYITGAGASGTFGLACYELDESSAIDNGVAAFRGQC